MFNFHYHKSVKYYYISGDESKVKGKSNPTTEFNPLKVKNLPKLLWFLKSFIFGDGEERP